MIIKKITGLFFPALIQCGLAAGQTISGHVTLDKNWKTQLYLLEVSKYNEVFSGYDRNIVDSIPLGKDGSFTYNKLKKNTLYRLNAVPKKEQNGGMLLQDGESDNYAFFVSGDQSDAAIRFKGALNHIYASYTLSSKTPSLDRELKQVLHLRALKFRHYETMHRFTIARAALSPSDKDAITKLEYGTMQQIRRDDDSLNVFLGQYMPCIKDPSILSLAIVYYGFDFHMTDTVVGRAIDRLEKMEATSLSQSILDRVASEQDALSEVFMQKNYPLLSGGTLKLGDIKADYILLDFWASWCVPCRKGIRTALKNLHQKYSRERLVIVGVITDDEKEKAEKAIASDQNDFAQIYQADGNELKNLFQVEALPYYLLINTVTGKTKHLRTAESIEDILDKEHP